MTLDNINKILNNNKDEPPEGMERPHTTRDYEDFSNDEEIKKSIDDYIKRLKEKFNYTYRDPLPSLNSEEEKKEFDLILAEVSILEKKLKKE